ncbi:MAG: hypothetical protein M0Q38_00735 [Bacteroidales bacterium]|jgi:hypothetical protein|nr:hypothetical protein [Bacteroidales bacterium]
MEKDDLLNDEFIGKLIQNSPLEQPSDDFVDRVMEKIRLAPENAPVEKPYFLMARSVIPYLVVTLIVAFIFFTSDLPILSWLPGKEYWTTYLIPYFETLFTSLKNFFISKYISLGVLIGVSVVFLFFIDRILSRKGSFHHHTLV